MRVQPTRRRFTVAEYYEMAKAGILGEDDRVELIAGAVIEMAPIGRRHAACVRRLDRLFQQAVGDAAVISVQNPVWLDERNEPQPDLELLRPRPDFYTLGHPTPADVLLIIEVAETSSRYDRQVKVPLYARHGIPECWLFDLDQATITVYREPTPTGYRTAQTVRRGEMLTPLAFPSLELAVTDILG